METTQTNDLSLATYQVELPDFQGPLDLLLTLIEQEELDITAIALAHVTDQYLAYLDILQKIDPDELADFLVVAAKLILIKSQVLLPRPPPSLIEAEEEDVGDELTRQLLVYKQFKKMAVQLQEIEAEWRRNFVRTAPPPKIETRLIDGTGNLEALLRAARCALAVKPPDPDVDEVVSRHIVTIGQQMAHIRQKLNTGQRLTFQELLSQNLSRLEVIVTLLAVLELIKRRVIYMEQFDLFGDIIIYKNNDVPELTESEWAELAGLTEVT